MDFVLWFLNISAALAPDSSPGLPGFSSLSHFSVTSCWTLIKIQAVIFREASLIRTMSLGLVGLSPMGGINGPVLSHGPASLCPGPSQASYSSGVVMFIPAGHCAPQARPGFGPYPVFCIQGLMSRAVGISSCFLPPWEVPCRHTYRLSFG